MRELPKAESDPVAGLCGHVGWKKMLGPHRDRGYKGSGSVSGTGAIKGQENKEDLPDGRGKYSYVMMGIKWLTIIG